MSDPAEQTDLLALTSAAAATLAVRTRDEVRRWIGLDAAAVLTRIDRLGQAEIAAAAQLTGRLATADAGGQAAAVLDRLQALVEEVHAEPVRPRFALSWSPAPIEARLATAEPALTGLLGQLALERDALTRAAVIARSLDERLRAAEAELEGAARFSLALHRAATAAGRELSRENPERAALLANDAAARLAERSGDLLTQLAVLRQARLSMALLQDGQEALSRAIDRTRHVMVAALRTAVAAVRAMTQGARMTGRAAALDQADARRAVTAALTDMRAALSDVSSGAGEEA